ncbi:hypothetical protein CCMSSC00406_0000601 [Pleurotus cornucopiae]|uniref:Uncharacterized protein n=1 Tax=Pleurotus cornucopiae TaxID=5321 RepID=A0ACB7JAZ5_PLECO|nr:hypothetical protein CCMSSC00406_0000601 [Pleurotus cornucopiae]
MTFGGRRADDSLEVPPINVHVFARETKPLRWLPSRFYAFSSFLLSLELFRWNSGMSSIPPSLVPMPIQFGEWGTRDTTDIPPDSQITNPIGRVVLGFETSESLNLMIDSPLAQGFLLKDGQVSITVPNVPPRNNYIVVVFGDSGNTSPQFRITGGAGNGTSSSATRSPTESPSVTAPIPISGTAITGGSAAGPTSTPSSPPATSSIVDPPTPASTQTTPLTTTAATSTAASSAESLAASSSSSDLPTGTALPADSNGATGLGMTLYYVLAPLTLWALL